MKRYIAQFKDQWNVGPIEGTTPNRVWKELEAATHKPWTELKQMGWRVMLDTNPAVAKPPVQEPELLLTEAMTLPIEDDSDGPNFRGWGIAIGISLVLWAIIYFVWIR